MIPQQEQQYLTHVLEELSKAYTTTAEAVTQKMTPIKTCSNMPLIIMRNSIKWRFTIISKPFR